MSKNKRKKRNQISAHRVKGQEIRLIIRMSKIKRKKKN